MALHLNLYHEVQKQREIQRRDPMKFAMAGLAGVGVLLAGYYFFQLNAQASLKREMERLKSQYTALAPKAEAAKKRAEEVDVAMKLGETLVNRMEQRFYWAPVLDRLMSVVPPEIQATKLTGEIGNDSGKRCSLTLEGRAAGEEPRRVAEELRRNILEEFSGKYRQVTASFRSLDDSQDQVALSGRKLSVATFVISIVLQYGEEIQPAPAASRKTANK